jgi:Glycosyltransferase
MVQRPQQIMNALSDFGHTVYYMEARTGNYIYEKKKNLFIVSSDFPIHNIEHNQTVVLWCSAPNQVINVDKIPHDYIVYDVVDDASEEFKDWEPYIDKMIKRSDVIFTTAENLFNKFKVKHNKVNLIKNGVDFKHFALDKKFTPKDLPSNKKIVGYVGALAPWIDWQLINEMVKMSKYNFVFIGPLYGNFKVNLIRSNVYFLGYKNYEELPNYIDNFDACIIPFKVNSMTNGCNPIKFYEYCALGKPVVSTAMKEMINYSELSYVSYDKAQFINNIDIAAYEKKGSITSHRINLAKENSWEERAGEILRILKKELDIF